MGNGDKERGRQGEINLKLKSQNSKLDIKLGVRSKRFKVKGLMFKARIETSLRLKD